MNYCYLLNKESTVSRITKNLFQNINFLIIIWSKELRYIKDVASSSQISYTDKKKTKKSLVTNCTIFITIFLKFLECMWEWLHPTYMFSLTLSVLK